VRSALIKVGERRRRRRRDERKSFVWEIDIVILRTEATQQRLVIVSIYYGHFDTKQCFTESRMGSYNWPILDVKNERVRDNPI